MECEATQLPSVKLMQSDQKLELEYVYGYQGQCARNNVFYNDAGGIVYHTAAVGIVYDKNMHSQVYIQT